MDNIIHDQHERPQPPADISVPAALRKAADIIDDNGLARGEFVDYQPGIASLKVAPVCAAGAIRIAYGYDPDEGAYEALCPALPALVGWLSDTQRTQGLRGSAIDVVGIWNDCLGDADEVAAELRQAADEIEDPGQWRTSSHSAGGNCVQAAVIPGDCHGACTCCGGDGTMGGRPCGLCQGSQTCGSH